MSRVALPALIGVGAGAVIVATLLPAPTTPGGSGYRTEPVSANEALCPAGGAVNGADLPNSSTSSAAGALTISLAGKPFRSPTPGTQFGVSARGPVVVRATGAAAAGLAVTVAAQVNQPGRIGYLVRPCPSATAVTWFVGGHTGLGRGTVVDVVNPDPTPAQFALDLYGPTGPVDSPNSHGLVVPANGSRTLQLTDYAPDVPLLGFSVTSTTGRVGALAYDYASHGLNSLGLTALAPTEPGTRLVIPGIPAGASKATLILLPLSSGVAQATLLTAGSHFVPVGGAGIGLTAGVVTTVDLTKGVGGAAAAVRLDSSVLVLAAVRYESAAQTTTRRVAGRRTVLTVTTTSGSAGEAVAVPSLTGPALLPGLSGTAVTTVYAAAAGAGGSISVSTWSTSAIAPGGATTIDVPGGRQVAVELRGVGGWSLLVTPLSGGPVSVAVGSVLSIGGVPSPAWVGMAPMRQTLELPAASFDLGLARP